MRSRPPEGSYVYKHLVREHLRDERPMAFVTGPRQV